MAITFGSGVNFSEELTYTTKVTRIDDTHFVVVYYEQPNGIKAKIGTITGANTVTYGAQNNVIAVNSSIRAVTMLDSTHVAIAYKAPSTDNSSLIIGSISGETITFGSSSTLFSTNSYVSGMEALSSTSLAVAYKDNIALVMKMVIVTISGTSITGYGTHYTYDSSDGNGGSLSKLSSTKLTITYTNSLSDGYCRTANVSGANISFGTPYLFYDATSSCNTWASVGLDETHFAFSYFTNATYLPTSVRIGTVSGDSISYGAEYQFAYSGSNVNGMDSITSSSFGLVYKDAGSSRGYATTCSVANGNEITVATPQIFSNSIDSNYMNICTNSVTALVMTAAVPNHATGLVGNIPPPTSVKSINGLARASVKSIKGLAIASVKSWNGLA